MKRAFSILLSAVLFAEVAAASSSHSITLTDRQRYDLELLLNKGFHPLTGFMKRADYEGVVERMRLSDGTVWPMPITLDIGEDIAKKIAPGDRLVLCDDDGTHLAALTVDELYQPDKQREAVGVYGTRSTDHAGVAYLMHRTRDYYIGGAVESIHPPQHFDFTDLRLTPGQLKEHFAKEGHTKVVAFQTRNPMHRAHYELTRRAAYETGAHLLVHPVVGPTKPGDIDYVTRVKCYKKLMKRYAPGSVTFSLLPLSMRMAGPREALWHAIIRKNYGCTHFIVGRDHAGPGNDRNGKPFYGPYDAQHLVAQYADEVGIQMVPMQEMVYVKNDDSYKPVKEVKPGQETCALSGTQLRNCLRTGEDIPSWFTFPEVAKELRAATPANNKRGFVLFLTGLPAAGKSTLAQALAARIMEEQVRSVVILDGDLVRKNLSAGLGFSRRDRGLNITRIGFVASLVARCGGIAICAPIAPYTADRDYNRRVVEGAGDVYIELHVSTPVSVCESRDPKGLYAKAHAGIIQGFTGVDDPYEVPVSPELRVDMGACSIEEGVQKVMNYLHEKGYIPAPAEGN